MNQEPLGLPKGSVTAILALIFSLTACVLFFTRGAIDESLKLITLSLVMFYAGARSNAPPSSPKGTG